MLSGREPLQGFVGCAPLGTWPAKLDSCTSSEVDSAGNPKGGPFLLSESMTFLPPLDAPADSSVFRKVGGSFPWKTQLLLGVLSPR